MLEQRLELVGADRRAPLVDLASACPSVGSTTALDVRDSSEMRTKSLRIASRRELLDDAVAGLAAGEPGRDDRRVQPLERTRDVDALAAGHGHALDARCR